MEKTNLVWAIIWGVVCVLCVIAIFWNPAHFMTAAIAAVFTYSYGSEYIKAKRNHK